MGILEERFAESIARMRAVGIAGWGLNQPDADLFDRVVIDGRRGCTSATCQHASHDPAARTYKLIARSGALIDLGADGDERFYALREGDDAAIFRVVDREHRWSTVDRIAAADVPDHLLAALAPVPDPIPAPVERLWDLQILQRVYERGTARVRAASAEQAILRWREAYASGDMRHVVDQPAWRFAEPDADFEDEPDVEPAHYRFLLVETPAPVLIRVPEPPVDADPVEIATLCGDRTRTVREILDAGIPETIPAGPYGIVWASDHTLAPTWADWKDLVVRAVYAPRAGGTLDRSRA